MPSSSKSRIVMLRSANNEIFEVEEAMAALSESIKNLVGDIGVNHVIPMPEVNSKTLVMVIEWRKKKIADGSAKSDTEHLIKEWEADFVEDLGKANFAVDLLCAASFLCVKELQDHMYQKVANLVSMQTLEEICKSFPMK